MTAAGIVVVLFAALVTDPLRSRLHVALALAGLLVIAGAVVQELAP